jgi:ABC-type branched-subunit amino acid transport system substrate-binding protein
MLKKGLFGMVLSVALVAMFFAPAYAAPEPYLVGAAISITGPGSEPLAPIKDALDIYFKEVNAKGGINGHPVKLLIEDTMNEPSRAATQARQLVTQNKVSLLILAGLSSLYAPVVQVAEQYNVPLLFLGVCPPETYPPKADPNQFCSTAFGMKFDSSFAVPFIHEQSKGSSLKLALEAMNVPLSRNEIDWAEQLAKGMGIEVVDKEVTPPPTADFTPFATKMKSSGATWAYSYGPWGMEVRTFEALRKLGWKGKYLAYGHIQAEDELKRLKDDDFYVYGTNAFFTDNTQAHQRIKAMSEKEKTVYPYTQLTDGWIGATVIEEVLKKVPWPATPDKVRESMNQVKVDTQGLKGGPIVWTKTNHYRTTGYYRAYKWDSKKNAVVIAKDWTAIEVK